MSTKDKDTVKQYNKDYQLKHKDDLKAKRQARNECQHCHKMVQTSNKAKHLKSKLCLAIQKQVNEPTINSIVDTLITKLKDLESLLIESNKKNKE